MECLNLASVFILFQSFASAVPGDDKAPRQPDNSSGPPAAPPISAPASPLRAALWRHQGGGFTPTEDVLFFDSDWLFRTSVKKCGHSASAR